MQEQAIKEKVKERYGKIAQTGTFENICTTTECCCSSSEGSSVQMAKNIGYDAKDLESVPESSILGVGCGAPVNFADIKEGEVVIDIGSGGGIDVFLSANKVKDSGKVIGIQMRCLKRHEITQNSLNLETWSSKKEILKEGFQLRIVLQTWLSAIVLLI